MEAVSEASHISVGQDYGHTLHYAPVVAGLRELNPAIHADMAGALNLWHPKIEKFAGLYCDGRHISAIDRKEIPEFKVWELVDGWQEIDPTLAASREDARSTCIEILPDAPDFWVGLGFAKTYAHGYCIEPRQRDGVNVLKRYRCFVPGKVRGPVIKVGWRHTFENIIMRDLTNLTRQSIGRKFGVDLNYVPVDAYAAFIEV